jgi:hypothetical protein
LGESWANPAALFFGNSTGSPSKYYQVNLQNLDPAGSGDLVVTADDGNDASHYIAFGMSGSAVTMIQVFQQDRHTTDMFMLLVEI